MVFAEAYTLPIGTWQPAEPQQDAGVFIGSTKFIDGALAYFFAAQKEPDKHKAMALYRQAADLAADTAQKMPNNVVAQTIYATLSMTYAGNTQKLSHKIRYANAGITAFSRAQQLAPENLEVIALRLITMIGVPSWFKNQTYSLFTDGEYFLSVIQENTLSALEKQHLAQYYDAVHVCMAELARRLRKPFVKKYLESVQIETFLLHNKTNSDIIRLYIHLNTWLRTKT